MIDLKMSKEHIDLMIICMEHYQEDIRDDLDYESFKNQDDNIRLIIKYLEAKKE